MENCITKETVIHREASSLGLFGNTESALKLFKTLDNLKNQPTVGDKNCERITEESLYVHNH